MGTWIFVIILVVVFLGAISIIGALDRIVKSTERSEELLERLVTLAGADASPGETRS